MEILQQFLIHTPVWAWVILVYLLVRGIQARRPADTTLTKIAVIPVLFTAWGIYDLVVLYHPALETVGLWLLGIVVGSGIGWLIVSRYDITVDRAQGKMHRPADFSLLPLLLVTFAVKYAFGAIGAVSPEQLSSSSLGVVDIALSGLFTGIFIGKFLRYLAVWRAAPARVGRHA